MADELNPVSGGSPTTNEDVTGLKTALAAALKAQKDAENQVKALRVEVGTAKQAGDTTKSDMDKVMAKLEAAEKRSQEAERRALHGEVVAATGLSMAKVGRLKGETVEDLMADAAEVFDWKPAEGNGVKAEGGTGGGPPPVAPIDKPEDKGSQPYGRPREKLTADPGVVDQPEKSPQEMADAILSRPF